MRPRCLLRAVILASAMVGALPAPADAQMFLRGDVDGSATLELNDAIRILTALFGDPAFAEAACMDAADVNDSGAVDIADAIALLTYLFSGGSPPAEPYPDAGEDPTEDDIPDCAGPPVVREGLLFTGDFEGGDFDGMHVTNPDGAAVVGSPAPVRAGRYAARFEISADEEDPLLRKRSELREGYDSETAEDPEGSERWYGWSIYLPADYADDSIPEIVTQFRHVGSGGGSPPISLWFDDGELRLVVYSDIVWRWRPPRGRWLDWVAHARWDHGSDGLFELWLDGQPIYRRSGQGNMTAGYDRMGIRVGIYKWRWETDPPTEGVERRRLYIDELRKGSEDARCADVAPPGAAPCRPF